jgi:hypothetical protein
MKAGELYNPHFNGDDTTLYATINKKLHTSFEGNRSQRKTNSQEL